MKRYQVRIAPTVRDLIAHLSPGVKSKVKSALRALAENSDRAKALRDELAGLRSFRVGRLRVIVRLRDRNVEVVALGHRRDIYERVAVELRRSLDR